MVPKDQDLDSGQRAETLKTQLRRPPLGGVADADDDVVQTHQVLPRGDESIVHRVDRTERATEEHEGVDVPQVQVRPDPQATVVDLQVTHAAGAADRTQQPEAANVEAFLVAPLKGLPEFGLVKVLQLLGGHDTSHANHPAGTVVSAERGFVVYNGGVASSWSGLSRTSMRPGVCVGCGCAVMRMSASGCSFRRPAATSGCSCAA